MTEPTFSEAGTYPAGEYLEDLFADKPTDLRFTKTHYKKIAPTTQHDKGNTTFEFNLLSLKSPYVYLLEDTYMGAQISITKQDGSVPSKTLDSGDPRYVAPINCAVSSLFHSITTYINDTQVEMSSYYQYRCYLNDVLSFSDLSKMSHMETTGLKLDAGNGDNSTGNNGFLGRSAWFKKNFKSGEEYRDGGCYFMAPFRHILWGCEKPIPPGVTVKFVLTRTTDPFYIMQQTADTNDYKVNILKIDIYVKVAGLQEPVWNEFQHRMSKEAIKYFVRKQDVKVIHLQKEFEKWTTESLFPDNQIPSKVFFALVETTAFSGHKHKNPYAFKRRWEKASFSNAEDEMKQKNLQSQLDILLKERDREREERKKETAMTLCVTMQGLKQGSMETVQLYYNRVPDTFTQMKYATPATVNTHQGDDATLYFDAIAPPLNIPQIDVP
jgi:hypothetical protein